VPARATAPISPLASVLVDIQRCVEARLFYPALLIALTVPEICSGLALEKSVNVRQVHYVDFLTKYTDPEELGLSGVNCYRLRGGVVHRADMAGHPHFNWTHVLFSLPDSPCATHGPTLEVGNKRALTLDVSIFCGVMIKAAESWYEDHKNDLVVVANMADLIRHCPNGLLPFVDQAVVASGA
jgi:hypothetical protein